jgi:hypothetical protein
MFHVEHTTIRAEGDIYSSCVTFGRATKHPSNQRLVNPERRKWKNLTANRQFGEEQITPFIQWLVNMRMRVQ